MRKLILFGTCIVFLGASNQVRQQTFYLFGTDLRIEGEVRLLDDLDSQWASLHAQLEIALDPDCKWRAPSNHCSASSLQSKIASIKRLASILAAETGGVFDIYHAGAKADLAGLSQGLVIDELLDRYPSQKAIYDFSGDIYFSGGFVPSRPIQIGDPMFSQIPYARVEMDSGWMITSVGKRYGARLTNPKPYRNQDGFTQVTLFARPGFSGARLDAWATAVAVGGHLVLDRLLELNVYRNQWAYLVFDVRGMPICSSNLACDLEKSPKLVGVRW